MRRDHASTPPKPESEMRAKVTNRSSSAGVGADGVGGGGSEAAESVSGMMRKVKPPPQARDQTLCRKHGYEGARTLARRRRLRCCRCRSFFARSQGLYSGVPA